MTESRSFYHTLLRNHLQTLIKIVDISNISFFLPECIRFPFVACEILTADVQTLLSAFFGKNPNHLNDMKKVTKGTTDSNDAEDGSPTPDETKDTADPPIESETEKQADDKKTEDQGEKVEKAEEASEEKAPNEADEENKENKEETEVKEEGAKAEDTPADDTNPEAKGEDNMTGALDIEEMPSDKSEEVPEQKDPMHLANYFFGFLEQKELNVTLVGYFCRFLNHLIIKRLTEVPNFLLN